MDVSYILSGDELFTLMSLVSNHTDAGKLFLAEVLSDAECCDLEGLAQKKMAKYCPDGQMELAPVIRMLSESLACADKAEQQENGWLVSSPWVNVSCEVYPHKEKHFKLTPIKI